MLISRDLIRPCVFGPANCALRWYDVPPHMLQFSHREVLGIIGNSFSGSSYCIALVSQLCLAAMAAALLDSLRLSLRTAGSSASSSSQPPSPR